MTLFERATKALELGQVNDANDALTRIQQSDPEGSQEMRLHYLQGKLLSDMRDYDQAYRFYEMALDVATASNDPDSQIVLIYLMGQLRYGAMRNREAQNLYEIAFELWSTRAKQLPHPPIDPEVKIRLHSGRVLWLIGEFDDAHATLGRALILAQYDHRIYDVNALREQVAGALWTLALVHRSQSDMLDGDAGYLRTALRRADKALGLFQRAATDQVNLARFHVQIAELYLDLAEAHRSRGGISAMRYSLRKAEGFIRGAEDYLDPESDPWAPLLAKLTGLRYDIMLLSPLALAMKIAEIEERLEVIERTAEELKDHIVTAKAATLRAEWLLSLGDTETARTALLLALKGFTDDGMGQATRAQRLLRRITNEQDISRP
ncbi:MAG TPA: hypothetical protein VE338_11760 [Ktedonobacterales bacterium]|nr:hypothetical protein [Ktedonobacterales bacterium]